MNAENETFIKDILEGKKNLLKEIKHTKDITNGLIFKYANNDGDLNNYRDVNYGCNNKYTIVPKEVSYINVYNKLTGELVEY